LVKIELLFTEQKNFLSITFSGDGEPLGSEGDLNGLEGKKLIAK
jgi:hypothetical protein